MTNKLDLSKRDTYVITRVRPLLPHEKSKGAFHVAHVVDQQTIATIGVNNNTVISHPQPVDLALGPLDTNEDMFNNIGSQILDIVIKGGNCGYIAYGQTGTGKTYTMDGVMNGIARNVFNMIPQHEDNKV